MCGIAGAISLTGVQVPDLEARLRRMSDLLSHRGPDGQGMWVKDNRSLGFAHRRLSIVDLSDSASQPMISPAQSVITYNGEIYNHSQLRSTLESDWKFRSNSDTEVLLASYHTRGRNCLEAVRGMFSFAIWDERKQEFFAARDRFGIKPFYYTVSHGVLYFASEMKALLPFVDNIAIDYQSLEEYLAFQYTLGERTLFEGILELPPGHTMGIRDGHPLIEKYWDVSYEVDFSRSESDFLDEIRDLTTRAVSENLSGDVEVGAYVSGGIDSSLVYLLANQADPQVTKSFHGRFTDYPGFDESIFATIATDPTGSPPHVLDIFAEDFEKSVSSIIYHLDTPTAGPGSFPQYMVSEFASQSVKVVLGGQGGDEVFGGYTRYLIAYLEQCLAAAIDGTYEDGRFVVTLESIIPNLTVLREYKPLIQKFWSRNLFAPLEERYFDLLDRSSDFAGILADEVIDHSRLYSSFLHSFRAPGLVRKEAYLDSMMRFDFKNLLPALLHVEDRMSMAHGLESRVPLLDHELVATVARVPADIKFSRGESKRLLKKAFKEQIPQEIVARRDKMGFPVPLSEWSRNELEVYFRDIFSSTKALNRDYLSRLSPERLLSAEGSFSRKSWVLLSLEIWQQQFHDNAASWKFS